jgi:S-adenosyl-L-methionine hydrolase (adenosine-forming)
VIVTFLSDYGPGDEYAGVVIGVIARLCPEARVIDLGHGVPPQDVRTGARRLARALPFVPAGVHLAVVDPGVGGTRRALALRTAVEDRLLVGPDNGLLISAAERFGGVAEAVEISRSPWRLEPVSATFHGRDIFGPVAGRLAAGAAVADAGAPLDPAQLVRLPALAPRREGGAVIVHVVEIDGFGNVMLDGALADLPDTPALNGAPIPKGRRFGDVEPGGLVLYEDSSGGLALAVNGASAAAALGVRTGDELRLDAA